MVNKVSSKRDVKHRNIFFMRSKIIICFFAEMEEEFVGIKGAKMCQAKKKIPSEIHI